MINEVLLCRSESEQPKVLSCRVEIINHRSGQKAAHRQTIDCSLFVSCVCIVIRVPERCLERHELYKMKWKRVFTRRQHNHCKNRWKYIFVMVFPLKATYGINPSGNHLRIRPNGVVKMYTRKLNMAVIIIGHLETDIFIFKSFFLPPKMRQSISSRANFFCCEAYYCFKVLQVFCSFVCFLFCFVLFLTEKPRNWNIQPSKPMNLSE